MARPIFQRITGREDVRFLKGKSGTAIAVGDLVTVDDDTFDVFPAATDKLVAGIAKDALGASSTAVIRYDVLKPGDVVRAKVATGTAALSEKGNFVDIGSASTGITTTESNNDARVVNWNGETGYLDIEFTSLQAGGPPTTVVPD